VVHARNATRNWGRYAAAGLAALVLCVSGGVYGKDYIHRPAQHPSQQPGPSAPLVVQSHPADAYQWQYACDHPKSAEQDNLCIERRAADQAERSANWARNTFWVGIVGTLAVSLTLFYTARAAQAALLNARAVIDAERPHLLYEGVELFGIYPVPDAHGLVRNSGPEAHPIRGDLTFINQGKTPCEVGGATFWLIYGGFPPAPDYGELNYMKGVWIPAGGPYQAFAIGRPAELIGGQRSALLAGKAALFLVGVINYKSVFGKKHITRFAYRFLPQHMTWIAEDAPAYWEYT
jgi:hypothetical protein